MTGRTAKGEATAKTIRQAILRIKNGRPKVVSPSRKISISSVAEECGLSRAAVLKYTELSAEIKSLTGQDIRKQRDDKIDELRTERQKSRELRIMLAEAKHNIEQLASINATLSAENGELTAIIASKNITFLAGRKSK